MEMRKTNVWVSRSLGLLFVFSSFGHFAEANSSKSQAVVQKGIKNSQVSGSTGRMTTIGRFCKKHWYLAIPAMGAAGYVAYRFRNKSTEQKNESNSVEKKSKSEQSGAAENQQSVNESQAADNSVTEFVDGKAQEERQSPELAEGQPTVNGNNDLEESGVEAASENPSPALESKSFVGPGLVGGFIIVGLIYIIINH